MYEADKLLSTQLNYGVSMLDVDFHLRTILS